MIDVFGYPRDFSVIRDDLHPFHPSRVVVLPSGESLRYDRWDGLRRRLDEKIERMRLEIAYRPPPLPDEKLDSIYWVMHHITGHYDRPDLFEDWACELADREVLASTGLERHFGTAIQFQMQGVVRVDCPPVDWWMFQFPEGIDWSCRDGLPLHALAVHICRVPWHAAEGNLMERVWTLAGLLGQEVEDWMSVSRMAPVDAARLLSRAIIELVRT